MAPYVDWFHLDVMDGHYVDNLSFGPAIVEAVRKSCDLPLHVHLMITDPVRYAPRFARAGAERISFHPEVTPNVSDAIAQIRSSGCGVGLAVHPDRGLEEVVRHVDGLAVVIVMTVRPGFGGQSFLHEVVPKIAAARKLVSERRAPADVEVDGGVSLNTVADAVVAGGNVLVAGSAIFDGVDPAAAARRLRGRLDDLEPSAR